MVISCGASSFIIIIFLVWTFPYSKHFALVLLANKAFCTCMGAERLKFQPLDYTELNIQ